MARQGIFTGFTPNDGLGDSLASGAVKVNANFTEIYDTFGDGTNLSVNAGSAGTWAKVGTTGIATSKNVGIGTTIPTAQLHVSGNALLSGITTGTFVGDGSGLTGVTAVGQGVVIKDSGTLVGVAQSINLDRNLDVTQVFGGNVTVSAADTVGFAWTAGIATVSTYSNTSGVATVATNAGLADTATLALSANYATVAGIVTYASASGLATEAGNATYSTTAGISSYTPIAGVSTLAGYATTSGIATVAQNLTGTPSLTVDNIIGSGIVTFAGQGSKMRFDFDSTGDMPAATSWRGMFAYANNTKRAYVSTGTTQGGYNGWRQIIHQDEYGNYFTVGVVTASKFAGDGSLLTNLPSTDSLWRQNATGINTVGNVGIGTTTADYKLKVVGNIGLNGRIDGTATDNVLPFLWSNYSSLPAAGINRGQFSYVNEFGKAYYARDIGTTITVTVSTDTVGGQASGVFYFNGVEKPASFPIARGGTYLFNQDAASNANFNSQEHPLMVSTTQDGELAGGDHYMAGITYKLDGVIVTMAGYVSGFGGATTRRMEWTPVAAAPNQLWYWCHHHTGQGNSFSINNEGWTELLIKNDDSTVGTGTEYYKVGVLTATTLYGDGSNLTGLSVSLGYATTAGIATVAQGLTGKPDILVDNINSTGIVTAVSYVGDGSGLTGITASGSGIIIKDGGTLVGTIGTIDFGANLSVSPASAGVVTVTGAAGSGGIDGISTTGTSTFNDLVATQLNVSGLSTYGGNVDVNAAADVSGNVTIGGSIFVADNKKLFFGAGEDLTIWHDGSNSHITDTGTGSLILDCDSGLQMKWGGSTKLEASSGGLIVTGVVTATKFIGDGSGLSGVSGGSSGVIIKEEGTIVGSGVTFINFVGTAVTATASGAGATVTITATGGGGGGVSTTGFGTYTAAAGTPFQVDSFPIASYSGAEYTFMIGLGTYRQSQKLLVMHDGTTAHSQEYGIMYSPEQQVSIAAAINSGNVEVKVTPESGISGLSTYRFVKTLIQNI